MNAQVFLINSTVTNCICEFFHVEEHFLKCVAAYPSPAAGTNLVNKESEYLNKREISASEFDLCCKKDFHVVIIVCKLKMHGIKCAPFLYKKYLLINQMK